MLKQRRFSFFRRAISFVDRVRYMAPLTGGTGGAIKTLVRIHVDRDALQLGSYRGNLIRFRGYDEQALREVLIDREYDFLTDLLSVRAVPTVLDIGAHIGTFAIWVLGINEKARVLSVEADPLTYQTAQLNVVSFVNFGADWTVINYAAGGEDGALLRLSNHGPSMSHRIDESGTVEVESISLTTLLDKIASNGALVDLLKIDIEGSEESFLCGAPDALKRVNALVIELHPQLCNVNRVNHLLEKHFDCIENIRGRKSSKPLLYCRRNFHPRGC